MQTKLKKTMFYAIPMLFLLIGFWTCFSPTIWVDEAFSLELIKHPFVELIKLDAMDVHPPLYYLIYKIAAMPILVSGGGY